MIADAIRDKAETYRMNAHAASERGETEPAEHFAAIAVVLFELADVFERELEEAA